LASTPKQKENQRASAELRRAVQVQFEALQEMYDALRFQFIAAELDLAITFCRVAATTRETARRKANQAKAEIAYEAAVHSLRGARLTIAMMREIREKTARLRSVWPSPHE
jgi:hypothetical protein